MIPLFPALLLSGCAPDLTETAHRPPDTYRPLDAQEHHSRRILVGVDGPAPILEHRGQRMAPLRRIGSELVVYEAPEGEDVLAVIAQLQGQPGLRFVEPDRLRQIAATDPYVRYQWGLDAVGAIEAQDAGVTGAGVVVAVVDSGVAAGGPDGITTLLDGYDFVDDDADADDPNGHGTHVAGTIAQATGNGVGVAGVAPGAAILPVRVMGADGTGYTSDIAAGILYAVDHGADVINLSLGSSSPSATEEVALLSAEAAGVLVVASSGNDGLDEGVGYPAAYEQVIAVGAADFAGARTAYSNAGATLELVAPGGDLDADLSGDGYGDGILQETRIDGTWGYYFYQGTSMAAPHVAGAAALLIAAGASAEEARALLQSTAIDQGAAGWDADHGYGLIDVVAALEALHAEDADADTGMDTGTAPDDDRAPRIDELRISVVQARVRFVIRTDEPAAATVCLTSGPCAEGALAEEHVLLVPGWAPTYNLTLTDAAGNSHTWRDRKLPEPSGAAGR